MKAVSVYLKQKLKEQFVCDVSSGNPRCQVLAVGVLEITTIFKRDNDNQIFLNKTFCSMEVELTWMGF